MAVGSEQGVGSIHWLTGRQANALWQCKVAPTTCCCQPPLTLQGHSVVRVVAVAFGQGRRQAAARVERLVLIQLR